MMNTRRALKLAVILASLSLLAVGIFAGSARPLMIAAPAVITPAPPPGSPPDAPSLSPGALIMPEDLAKILRAPGDARPLVIQVGFRVLYAQGHIPGAEHIGPASEEEMLAKLQKRVASLPRGTFIVLYCGCCPWVHCPTVRPAYAALHRMGFTRLKVLYIANNFGRDWMSKGYPTEQGE